MKRRRSITACRTCGCISGAPGATSARRRDMRGPGAVPGLYATESAMNELADQLKIDPVQLRILNEPKIDEGEGIPFSSRHYVECLQLGAEKFGWSKRNPEVGSMKRDGLTLGWGVAGRGMDRDARFPPRPMWSLRDDGTARVACGTQDIGTGTYTVLAQLTSEKTGVPSRKSKWCSAIHRFRLARSQVVRWATGIGGSRCLCRG